MGVCIKKKNQVLWCDFATIRCVAFNFVKCEENILQRDNVDKKNFICETVTRKKNTSVLNEKIAPCN